MSRSPSSSWPPQGISGWRKNTNAGTSARLSARWRLAARERRHVDSSASSRNDVGAAVPLADDGALVRLGDDEVVLRLDVAAARRLLGGAQAQPDLVVGHRL